MHIVVPTDIFPPGSVGGAAWSTHVLAHTLTQRGHQVTVVVPVQGQRGTTQMLDDGVAVVRWGYTASRIPFVQNYTRHEQLWPRLAAAIVAVAQVSATPPALIHAQHVQTTPAAVLAGRWLGIPVVATVRDHWPWDYFATGLHGDRLPYARNSAASLATDLVARQGPLRGVVALPAIPYMLAHVQRRTQFLAHADAVIAVSGYIAQRLQPIVAAERLRIVPNMVDLAANEQVAQTLPQTPLPAPFVLFVGKLERNKGAGLLSAIIAAVPAAQRQSYTLVIAGNGSLQSELARELARLGQPTRFLAWVDHDEVLRLMARCALLVFPSTWGEPLSRVLLEASSVGAPIVAMPTGGTSDIIDDGVNGALARTPAQVAQRLVALLGDPSERQRLSTAAQRTAAQRFATTVVAPQVERVYSEVGDRR